MRNSAEQFGDGTETLPRLRAQFIANQDLTHIWVKRYRLSDYLCGAFGDATPRDATVGSSGFIEPIKPIKNFPMATVCVACSTYVDYVRCEVSQCMFRSTSVMRHACDDGGRP